MIINRSHPLSDLLSFGIIVLSSLVTLILLTSYSDSPTKQIVGACAIAILCVFALHHDKITISFLALIFFSQFAISLYTYRITSLAFLQFTSKDVFIILLAVFCFSGKAIRRYDSIAILLTIYIIWNMIIINTSFYPIKSKVEIITLAKYLLVYLCCLNMPKNNKLLRGLMWVIVAIVAIQSLVGILQYVKGGALGLGFLGERTSRHTGEEFYYEGGLRVAGTAGVQNTFSLLLSMLLTPIIYFTFQTKKTIFYSVISAGILTLLLTFSRAGWVSFIFGYLVVLLLIFMRNKGIIKKLVVLNLIVAIILALIASVFFDKIKGRFTDKTSTGAAEVRVKYIYQTFDVIKKYPIYGIGLGITEYLGRWNDNYIPISKLRSIKVDNQVHNGYLQIVTESGIPGGIVWFIIVGNIVWFFIKTIRKKEETTDTANIFTLGLFGSVFAFLIHINFGTEINNPMVNILFFSFLGILRNKNDVLVKTGNGEARKNTTP